MRSFLPLTVCCVSLVFLRRLSALPVPGGLGPTRLDVFTGPVAETERNPVPAEGRTNQAVSSQSPNWPRHGPVSGSTLATLHRVWPQLAQASGVDRRLLRIRRHAHVGSRGGHHPHPAQLMRVACVLGTCQVQNLSHRLYQLIGQSGREESSPMNPKSPHSYG